VSIFDPTDTVRSGPSWRCPECRTLQSETTRCWRCDKPAFTCESCHFFRASVAADLGYCAKDASRMPLHADEERGCWESARVVGLGTATEPTRVGVAGLFAEAEIAPPAPLEPKPSVADARAAQGRARSRVKPTLEEPGRAAWAEPEGDALVEAPVIEPGKRLSTEVQRRRRRWFR